MPESRSILPVTGRRSRRASSASCPRSKSRTAAHAAAAAPIHARTKSPFRAIQSEKSMSACVIGGSAVPPDLRNSASLGITATTRYALTPTAIMTAVSG